MLVMKFGGAALADSKNFKNVEGWVVNYQKEGLVVVVSAMKGVTNQLLSACDLAVKRMDAQALRELKSIEMKHLQVVDEVLHGVQALKCREKLSEVLNELQSMLHAMSALRECTARARDYFVTFGERLSAFFLMSVLELALVNVRLIPGESLIRTDSNFGNAYPDYRKTRQLVSEELKEGPQGNEVIVVPGFTASNEEGDITTLGRGGTDWSASIIAYCLHAREAWFLKEVDGILTTDPTVVNEARVLDVMSYKEVAELSYFGAKVLHPVAIHPLRERGIKARIRNVYNPDCEGTVVMKGPIEDPHPARAITTISGISMITVEGDGMIGVIGVAGRVFARVAREGVNVLMISQSSSEQNICLAVSSIDSKRVVSSLEKELELEILKEQIEQVVSIDDLCIVSLVGEGMSGTPGIAGKLFSILGEAGVNVNMIAQGSSELNISFLIEEVDRERAIRQIHEGFELHHTRKEKHAH